MQPIDLLRPALLLGAWTVVMTIWLFFARVPAMARFELDPQDAADTSRLRDLLPAEVQRVADNYNHLFEQPTLFYAMVAIIAILDHVDEIHVAAAWIFVGLRIAHSCVQATVNIVPIRFGLFLLSWFALATMILRALAGVW